MRLRMRFGGKIACSDIALFRDNFPAFPSMGWFAIAGQPLVLVQHHICTGHWHTSNLDLLTTPTQHRCWPSTLVDCIQYNRRSAETYDPAQRMHHSKRWTGDLEGSRRKKKGGRVRVKCRATQDKWDRFLWSGGGGRCSPCAHFPNAALSSPSLGVNIDAGMHQEKGTGERKGPAMNTPCLAIVFAPCSGNHVFREWKGKGGVKEKT